MHRFSFDGRYLYGSPTLEGYVGNVMGIFDLKNPAKPELVGHWHMPGQWIAGGETPSWPATHHRCHHPLRLGNRLYTSYWLGGFVIIDIEDMSKPKFVSGLDWSPPFPSPDPQRDPGAVRDRRPQDPSGRRRGRDARSSRDRRRSSGSSTSPRRTGRCRSRRSRSRSSTARPRRKHSGCHQPIENITGTEIPAAWFMQRHAHHRHRPPARAEGGRALRAGRAAGLRPSAL